jgi:hypothetical protein
MAMIELVRTNEPVFLSWLLAALQHEGIEAVVLDAYASAADGSIPAIPRRVMVDDGDESRARRVLALADELGQGPKR